MKELILLTTAVIFVLCNQTSKIDKKTEGEALILLSQEWSDVVATGDLDKILEGWAEDAVMMDPGLSPFKGKDAIKGYVQAGMKIPGFSVRWEPLEVFVSDCDDIVCMIETMKWR
jgi:ketosteroid isomerase-like protein